LQATDINSQAAAMCAGLQHMSAEGRCQVLAKVFPAALCPEHRMLHSLRDCPLAVDKAKGVVKHVHATTLADEASQLSDGIVHRVRKQIESVVDSRMCDLETAVVDKLSVFASGFRPGQGDYGRSHYDSDRRGYSGGYGQSRPIGAGYQEQYNSRASPHRPRPPPPVCNVCDQRGHSAESCWIVFPDKCKDRRVLEEMVVPEHLQGIFQAQLAKLRLSGPDASHTAAAEPLPGDVYPPRAPAQHHGVMNHCVVSGLWDVMPYGDDLVTVDNGDWSPTSASAFINAFASVGIEFGDEESEEYAGHLSHLTASSVGSDDDQGSVGSMPGLIPASDSSDCEDLPALASDSAEDLPCKPPLARAFVDLRDGSSKIAVRVPESSDSSPSSLPSPQSEVSPPVAASPVAEFVDSTAGSSEAQACACGSVCRLQLEVLGDGGVVPVWQCPSASSPSCVSGVLAEGASLVQAFLARYSGAMPASFRPTANASMLTRSAARAATQAAQSADNAMPVPTPVEPVPTVVATDTAQVDPAEPTADPAAPPATTSTGAPPSTLQGTSTSRAARQPVSFAPDLATAYRQSVPGVPGLIESSVTNGFVVVPVGNLTHLLSAEGQRQLGLDARSSAASLVEASDVELDAHSVARTFTTCTRAAGLRRREVGVCQLAQPEGRPRDCMFIRTPEGVNHLPEIVFADTASDTSIVKKKVTVSYGIITDELANRTVHMSTVGGGCLVKPPL
jgi:hypothetical protein